jgi:hypothetical protein
MKRAWAIAIVLAALSAYAGEDRWRGFNALTASEPTCAVGEQKWTYRDKGVVTKIERDFRVTVKWKQWDDGTQVTYVFWWSAEPNRRKAYLECADWLDEADRRIAAAQERADGKNSH